METLTSHLHGILLLAQSPWDGEQWQGMGPEAGPLELSVAQVNMSSDGTGSNLGPGYTHPCP